MAGRIDADPIGEGDMRRRRLVIDSRPLAALVLGVLSAMTNTTTAAEPIAVTLRSRVELTDGGGRTRVVEKSASWDPKKTAIVVCDMWDLHHCLNATRRGAELAPRMDQVFKVARDRGVLIVHAPSGCMDAYKDHPARARAKETTRSQSLPGGIGSWCYKIPAEERGSYPIDQTDGGEDDDPLEHAKWAARLAAMGRNPKAPWKSQTDKLTIDAGVDLISDDGEEIWSALEARGIDNVILLGVHLNMCVLGRPFGLRQMAKNGKNVVLMRDMTDTMYNPARAPYVSHFSGTDLMVEHVEKFVAPTITSDQILGGSPFRFRDDRRPLVAFVISEDEYRTAHTLPAFAARELSRDCRLAFIFAADGKPDDLSGLEILDDADLAVFSLRRRALPEAQVAAIRRYVASGRPLIGLRTASHGLSPKESPSPGRSSWTTFDADVLGGSYAGHHRETEPVAIALESTATGHPILSAIDPAQLSGRGTLYKVRPLANSTTPLLLGTIPGQEMEPVAWTNLTASGGRVFYTSLGHPDDFAEPAFNRLLRNAVDWAVGRDRSEAIGR